MGTFLLRFQEIAGSSTTNKEFSKNHTLLDQEKSDTEKTIPLSGTQTMTDVKREQADNDPAARCLCIVPRR
jgi:hypothetical protein